MSDIKTIKVFCADQQAETDHTIDINGSGEIILSCVANTGTEKEPVECGRSLKFPKGTDAKGLKKALATHKAHNEGQISVASIEAEKAKLIAELVPDEE